MDVHSKKYQLRWKNGNYNSLNTFKSIFGLEDGNNKQSLPNMIDWIRSTVQEMPKEYANILIFNTLTGLRPDEAYKAIHFIKNNSSVNILIFKGTPAELLQRLEQIVEENKISTYSR